MICEAVGQLGQDESASGSGANVIPMRDRPGLAGLRPHRIEGIGNGSRVLIVCVKCGMDRDWYFIAEQPAPAPHLTNREGCAALTAWANCVGLPDPVKNPPTGGRGFLAGA